MRCGQRRAAQQARGGAPHLLVRAADPVFKLHNASLVRLGPWWQHVPLRATKRQGSNGRLTGAGVSWGHLRDAVLHRAVLERSARAANAHPLCHI